MAKYKSFITSKNKLEKIWDQSQDNTDEINENIQKISIDFNSVTISKKVNIFTLLDNALVTSNNYANYQFEFSNFPDWAVNFARPLIFYTLDSAYNIEQEKDEFVTGEVEIGDFQVIYQIVHTWWIKEGDLWRFNVLSDGNPRAIVTTSPFGYSAQSIPSYITIKLYILNEKNYNEIQSGK